jgi:ribosomal protein S18 acetylase RimI-like enzyme
MMFRRCQPDDVDAVLPLMYSSGPEAFRYVFSVRSELQVLDFLRAAFVRGEGEFGYKDHFVAVDDGEIVALVGMRSAQDHLKYLFAIIRDIFGFYGLLDGIRVVVRGLRFEKIVAPPRGDTLSLHNLGVKEALRGRGYGRQLIAWFLEQARDQQVSAVGLDVAETNPRARALYMGLDFEVKRTSAGGLSNKYGRGVAHEYMEYSL